jgi:mono/diheme cytochrome c family protein
MGRTSKAFLALALACLFAATTVPLSPQARKATPRKFTYTKERWERGKYLVQGPVHCLGCHSEADWRNTGLPLAGREGAGQKQFPDEAVTFPLPVPNITPDVETGSGSWTDEQFERALRQGIGSDGRVLLPLMPYGQFRNLSDEDLASVVVYIRSLKPVKNAIPGRQLPPPLESSLEPLEPVRNVKGPDLKDREARGKYLVSISNCDGCHSPESAPFVKIPGMEFGGGMGLHGPWGKVASANITPDPSGISYYDEKMFLTAIRTGHVGARKLNQIMIWRYFRNMTDDDLKSIWAYLKTLKPVQHRVDNTEPPTPCKLCNGVHGAGVLNDSLVAGAK